MNPKLLLIFYVVYITVGATLGLFEWQFRTLENPLSLKREISALNCTRSSECGHGTCEPDGPTGHVCVCKKGWINRGRTCNYEQRSKLAAFLISLFAGTLGADWFYLALGNGLYIFAGIVKLLTIGCGGIWWLVDWIRILADGFPDGNGVALGPW